MIKASELRTGNLVQLGGNPEIVLAVDSFGLELRTTELIRPKKQGGFWISLNRYKPILLNEEWIVWLGFNKLEDESDKLTKGLPVVSVFSKKGLELSSAQPMHWRWHGGHAIKNINDVHSLQNLYFALTGEELKLQ